MNTCEICGEEELTLMVLEAMRKLHDTDGNIITFNIALKRLAKQGQSRACEGIIIGMLQAGVEPTVVSYTTAIGACVKANDSLYAYEWLKRKRSRHERRTARPTSKASRSTYLSRCNSSKWRT